METKKGYKAFAKALPMSAKKVRPIADEIRKKSYTEVVAVLESIPNKGAFLLKKVIMSAAANALVQNKQLSEDTLIISKLLVDEGPSSRRVWARARGRADRLIKRTCHIYVEVDEKGAKK